VNHISSTQADQARIAQALVEKSTLARWEAFTARRTAATTNKKTQSEIRDVLYKDNLDLDTEAVAKMKQDAYKVPEFEVYFQFRMENKSKADVSYGHRYIPMPESESVDCECFIVNLQPWLTISMG
jgi:hypothetical protein